MFEYVVDVPFTWNGVDYQRGDVISGSLAGELEGEPHLVKRCVRRKPQ